MVPESRFARILRRVIGVESEIFLRSIGQQPRENLSGRQMRVEFLGLDGHAQRVMFTANLNAFAATFAKIRNKDGEEAALASSFLFNRTENCGNIIIGQ